MAADKPAYKRVSLSQAEYDAIDAPDGDTIYFINGDTIYHLYAGGPSARERELLETLGLKWGGEWY